MQDLDKNVLVLILEKAIDSERPLWSLRNFLLVNRTWRDAVQPSNHLWRVACESAFSQLPTMMPAGLTVREVCKSLVEKKEKDGLQVYPEDEWSMDCDIACPPPSIKGMAPETPFVPLLDDAARGRILNNATSLLRLGRASAQARPDCATALCRYRAFLALRRQHPRGVVLAPTLDIAMCQVSHILRTSMYWEDMARLNLDTSHAMFLSPENLPLRETLIDATRKAWRDAYGVEYDSGTLSRFEPDLVVPTNESHRKVPEPENLEISLTAADVEADFKWLDHFVKAVEEREVWEYGLEDDDALFARLLEGYDRYLFLVKKDPHARLVPDVTLDLMWHAHQLNPVLYKLDVEKALGFHLQHLMWGGRPAGESLPLKAAAREAFLREFKVEMGEWWQYDASKRA